MRSWTYTAWMLGVGALGAIAGAAVAALLFTGTTDIVAGLLWSQVLGGGGALIGAGIGGLIGIRHEDRIVRRRMGLLQNPR